MNTENKTTDESVNSHDNTTRDEALTSRHANTSFKSGQFDAQPTEGFSALSGRFPETLDSSMQEDNNPDFIDNNPGAMQEDNNPDFFDNTPGAMQEDNNPDFFDNTPGAMQEDNTPDFFDNNSDTSTAVSVISDHYIDLRRQGEDIPIEEFAARYPAYQAELLELLPMIDMMEWLGNSTVSRSALVAQSFEPGSQLGDFQLVQKIGQGGMGVVYEARQLSLNRIVAVKILSQAPASSERAQRFEKESQIIALLRHTNIVDVFGAGRSSDCSFYVMELIDGGGLNEVDWRKPFPGLSREYAVAKIGLQAAKAIAYAHNKGVVHRDIKPSNLLLDKAGVLHVSDFGLATVLSEDEADKTLVQSREGTLRYMAPERLKDLSNEITSELSTVNGNGFFHSDCFNSTINVRNAGLDSGMAGSDNGIAGLDNGIAGLDNGIAGLDNGIAGLDNGIAGLDSDNTESGLVDPCSSSSEPVRNSATTLYASDQYSLGLSLYELIKGSPAFSEPTPAMLIRKICNTVIPPLKDCDRCLAAIIEKSIRHNPEERYASMDDMAADLSRYLKGEPVKAMRISPLRFVYLWWKRRPGMASMSMLAVLLAVSLLISVSIGYYRTIVAIRTETQLRELLQSNCQVADAVLERVFEQAIDVNTAWGNQPVDSSSISLLQDLMPYYEQLVRQTEGLSSERIPLKSPSWLRRLIQGSQHQRIAQYHAVLDFRIADAQRILGVIALRSENPELANTSFQTAAKLYPVNSDDMVFCNFQRSIALAKTNKLDEARQLWLETLECQPVDTNISFWTWTTKTSHAERKNGISGEDDVLYDRTFDALQPLRTLLGKDKASFNEPQLKLVLQKATDLLAELDSAYPNDPKVRLFWALLAADVQAFTDPQTMETLCSWNSRWNTDTFAELEALVKEYPDNIKYRVELIQFAHDLPPVEANRQRILAGLEHARYLQKSLAVVEYSMKLVQAMQQTVDALKDTTQNKDTSQNKDQL